MYAHYQNYDAMNDKLNYQLLKILMMNIENIDDKKM